ncbi:uncharacterized protein [Physcomitrium patens]|uniref:uncharacterized protein n=1 Tax=Physcomitrium patens TaxID=3218 RepID=UPI003CCC901A
MWGGAPHALERFQNGRLERKAEACRKVSKILKKTTSSCVGPVREAALIITISSPRPLYILLQNCSPNSLSSLCRYRHPVATQGWPPPAPPQIRWQCLCRNVAL